MAKMNGVDWIFFDVGGVLADDTKIEETRDRFVTEAVSKVRRAPTRQEMHAARIAASKLMGNMSDNTIAALVSDASKCALAQAYSKELWKNSASPITSLSHIRPEAKKILEALSPNYKLGIMANQPASTKEKLEKAGIAGFFTQTGMSHDYGFHKPDPRLYEEVLRETGAVAGRSVMVDDNYERGLRTAKTLGFKTVWYVETNSRFMVDDADPNWKITRLEDLVSIFA